MRLFFKLLILAIIIMQLNCVHPCDGSFSSRAGLTRHQNACQLYRTSQILKQEQRRARHALMPKVKLKARSKPAGKSLDIRKSRINAQARVSGTLAHLLDLNYWPQALRPSFSIGPFSSPCSDSTSTLSNF